MPIPTTTEQALAALVEQDVAKWGEAEREASRRIHGPKSLGLLLNTLASRAELAYSPGWEDLRAAADAALTPKDWAILRNGG